MWIYEKKLEFPVKITKPDARLAKIMIEQYGVLTPLGYICIKNNRIALAVLLFVFQYPPSFLSCNALDVFHVNYFSFTRNLSSIVY